MTKCCRSNTRNPTALTVGGCQGKIYSGYTDKQDAGDMVIDQGKMKKYVIHDYFKPGLKNELKKAGIAIQKG